MQPRNLSDCDDTEVIIAALRDMPDVINIKAAGTAMRFMTAYLSATPGEHTITGTERMQNRPIGILVDALRYLGADITYEKKEGYPPLPIRGKALEGGHLEVVGNISSQYISALLMIGPILKNGLELKLTGEIASRPYIDLTLWTMKEYGADADWTDMDTITVKPQPYKETSYMIENDWSASSYWYEMMALNGNIDSRIQLEGLMDCSKQGDSVVKYIFSLLGVKSEFENRDVLSPVKLKVQRCLLPRFDYDFSGSPDLAQTIVVACCALGVKFKFTGLASLKIKETDRIEALKRELRKLGYVLRDENGDTLVWDGTRCEPTLEPIDTYDDHRMAMGFALTGLRAEGIVIDDPGCCRKTFENYFEVLDQVTTEIYTLSLHDALPILKKVGYVIYDENDNTLIWDGETCEPSFEPIDTYEDHRMALAFAPLAFKFPQIEINNPEVVSKSYPHYWEDLKKVGFEIVES